MKRSLAKKKALVKAGQGSAKIVAASRGQLVASPEVLLADVRELILAARQQVARAVDSGLVTLYWHVGHRVHQDILKEKRAGYGEKIVATLSRQLEAEFGRGFAEKNLRRMAQFRKVVVLTFIPGNFARIMRAVAAPKHGIDKHRHKRLPMCSAPALDLSTPRGHAVRPLAGLFFPHAC